MVFYCISSSSSSSSPHFWTSVFRRTLLGHGVLTLLVLSCCALQVPSECLSQCPCPSPPASCPPGVSSVLDSCGCCRVCARQFNQDCGPLQPCDHIKGLHCLLGAGGDPRSGLCRAEAQGRPCELDGRVYQHGEDFQPSCEHRCSCIDGVVGCVPLCPHLVPLPDWRCSRPRLATPPGRCCQEWVCDDDNRIDEGSNPTVESVPLQIPRLTSNELLGELPTPWDGSAGAPYQEWMSSSQSHALLPSSCFLQTTDWSPCSASCGMGVSSRVTNNNAGCRLVRETRLCLFRDCDDGLELSLKKGKRCQRTVRPQKAVPIRFAGCSTSRGYRPRRCGTCADGRCCVPTLTRTVRLQLRCPQGDAITRDFMWIEQCSCSQTCPSPSRTHHTQTLSLPNDIHTYTH